MEYSKETRNMFRRGFMLISEGSQLVEEAYIMHEEQVSLSEDQTSGELRPCPFCKVVPENLEFCSGEREYDTGGWDSTHAVCCLNPECETHGPFALTEELAVEAWNDV